MLRSNKRNKRLLTHKHKPMKNLIVVLAFLMVGFVYADAQKFAYVDTERILEQLPEYQDAQKEIDKVAEQWRKDIDGQKSAIEEMYREYQAEQVLLTEDLRRKREEEIMQKEREVNELRKTKFGYGGELFKKREEMTKPIQDKVYAEIEKLATTKGFDFIFDKSSGVNMLYANPKFDKTEDILKALGIN